MNVGLRTTESNACSERFRGLSGEGK